MAEQNLFTQLRKLFAGDVVVRKVDGGKRLKVVDVDKLQSMGLKTNYQIDRYARVFHPGSYSYNAQISYQTSRLQLYNDYEVMDADPIIASALDVYADESTTKNEYKDVLKITTDDETVSEILHNLFYDVINIDFNLWMWIRNMAKYGNQYLKLDISEKFGVVNVVPLPVYEVTREEFFDQQHPHAVRFKVQGSYGNGTFEYYEVIDFRLMSDSNFLPYGKAMIESARKVWKQLTLMEDAMLIHRIMRAPEKRIFKIDIGNIPANEVDQYMAKIIDKMKKTPYIDPATGDYNLKFNMMNMTEDFYLPQRGNESNTSIDTIKGLEFNAIEDIEYLRNKMMAALKIPKAFLGYEEQIGAKATLAAEDVRFARTIERIQRIVIGELTKIAVIHLYSQGITDERLVNFELELTNPSTIAEQEKLALWETKVRTSNEILTANPLLSTDWIYKNIWGFSDEDIKEIRDQIINDKKRAFRYTQIEAEGNDPVKTGQSFGTPHDLQAVALQKGREEAPDYGQTNFSPDNPMMVQPNLNIPVNQVTGGQTELNPDLGGRPPEGQKYGKDSHVRGRDPLGAKDIEGSLDIEDDPLGIRKKKVQGEQVQKTAGADKKKLESLVKRVVPPKWQKSKDMLTESIQIEGEGVEKPQENEGFLNEKNLDIEDANSAADAINE
jgi:hypothetical protein